MKIKRSRFAGWRNGTGLRRLISPPPGTAAKLLICRRNLAGYTFSVASNPMPLSLDCRNKQSTCQNSPFESNGRQNPRYHDSARRPINRTPLFMCYPDGAGATRGVTLLDKPVYHERWKTAGKTEILVLEKKVGKCYSVHLLGFQGGP